MLEDNNVMQINEQVIVNIDVVIRLIDQLLILNHLYQEHVNEEHDVQMIEYLKIKKKKNFFSFPQTNNYNHRLSYNVVH
jgi:hypothetical protein